MITLLYAGLLSIIYVMLGFYVVKNRRMHRVSLGVGHNVPALERAVRIHGNFGENVPLFLVLLTLIEMNAASPWLIHVFGIMMIIGRIFHALGIRHKQGASYERIIGMVLTWLSILGCAFTTLWLVLRNGVFLTF